MSTIFRREGVQHKGNIERLAEMLGTRDGFNSQEHIWRVDGRIIELGACKDPSDVEKHQGRPKDLIVFDEICHFLKTQYLFLKGWNRTTRTGQRCRVVCTGNPPTTAEGQWVIEHWAPWLDRNHPNPAMPGELRWFAMIDGEDTELLDGKPFYHKGELVKPKSRTFIPSKVTDNPFLVESGYISTLQALPEPLRSQMLHGDYLAGMEDDPWQVIPTAWVEQAQARWKEDGARGPMTTVGLDVARGGKDRTIAAPRYGTWYDRLKCAPGKDTPDGAASAGLAVASRKDGATVNVDVIGVGASAYDFLMDNGIAVNPINGAEKSSKTDRSGQLKFANMRSAIYWLFREALDPEHGSEVALPPGTTLKADLCAPRWKLTTRGVQVESKEDIYRRIGRSPDEGDAVVYASVNSDAIFDRNHLRYLEVRPETLNVYIIVSRASSRRAGANNTAIAVIGVDTARKKILMDGYCHEMTPLERWQAVSTLRKHWMAQKGVQIVSVGYDRFTYRADIEFCEQQMMRIGSAFPIAELVWPQDNEEAERDRISRLLPDFARGAFYLVARVKEETSLQTRMRQQGKGHLVLNAVLKRDAGGAVYSLNNKFTNEYLVYPSVPFADMLDACSRLYDMDYAPPQIINERDLEPEEFFD